ncbi:MAG: hypothetical protein IPH27_03090 [Actinomycetales bacterium]|nr:hypothetical protein [Candidatus Phosphoribacter baldrii]
MTLLAPAAAAYSTPTVAAGTPALAAPAAAPQAAPAPLAAPAPAPAGNELNGVVWLDLDGDGINDATETGFTGAVVTLRDGTGTVVATRTTTSTGLYSFTGLTPGQGPYSLTITRSTTTYPDPSNWVISAPPGPDATPYVGTDNDATAGSDPRVGTIANVVPGTSYDIAIRPRPELSLGFFGPGIIDGTGPFNTLGGCTSATAMGQPGDDCGTSNSQLRTGDTLTTVWSITADNFEPGTTSWGDVVFEQTIVPTGGAVATFTSIPVSCVPPPNGTGGTGSPASAILTNYPTAGQTTLRCNLGQFVEGGQESLTTAIKLSALSPNGSSFTTTEKVYAAATGDRAVPAIGPTVGPIIASARPAYDLVKLGFRSQRPEVRCVDTDSNPATPCENLQGYTLDTLIRLTAAQKVGIEAIQQPFTFTDTVSAQLNGGAAYPVEYYVAYCYANDSGWGDVVLGRPYGRTPISDPIYYPRTVDESGTCTATRPSGATTTTPYSMSITGADLDGSRFPSATWGGTDLSAGPFILAEHRVGIFIPFRSVDATDGTTNGAGSLQLFNRYSGFDPAGVSGTSNYGTGFEPGYCPDSTTPCNPTTSTVATSNNVIGPNSILLSTSGSMSKYQMYRADNWGSYTIQPGSAATHDGAGLTEPGDYTASWINFTNSGSNDVINPGVCDIFDNTVWKLATADKVKFNTLQPPNPTTTYAYVTRLNQLDTTYTSPFTVAWPSNFRVEYAHLPISGDDPLYNAARVPVAGVIDSTPFAGVDTFNTATGRYEGVWTSQKAQRCTDGAAVGGWQTDPAAVPGGVDGVNAVRFVSVDPNFILKPTAYIRAIVPMQTRSTFNGGPYAGQVIPAGTVFADLGLVRADNLNYGGALGNWRPADYQPSPETTHSDGDRSTLSRFNSLLQKHTLTPLTNVGATTSTLAGNQIVWELIPAVQTKLSPSAEIAKNVVITDVLPPYTTYNAACTAALNNSTATATILPVNVELNTGMTGPQAGYTRLTYQLGDLPVNVAIPRIRICTDTDPLAPNGTSVMNVARLTATDDITALSLRQDDHTIILEQNGSMQIGKTVDRRLDPLNDTQVYTVEYANFATAFTINPPTMIDVFPWNGDVLGSLSERDPASNYHGSLTLTAAPTVTWKNGSVPGATDPYAAIGTFYYTKDASSTVNYNPDANTSTWCSTADGGVTWTPQAPAVASDCPTSFAAVTAFKFVSNYVLDIDGKPRQGQKITFTLKATDNQPADRYTNRATVDTTSLPATQFLRSNNVIVQVPSYNLGDLIFGDLNRNGTYEAAADLRAPAGVVVDLYQAGQTPGVDAPYRTTTTNANGRYQFTLLGDGDYFVVVPASQFVVGGPLASWVLDPAGLQADPNTNLNDTGDHHAIGLTSGTVADGIRSSGTIRLSATVPANPLIAPTGDEPLGDNTGNLPSAVSDDFTNYTLDLGLIPPSTPSVALKKFTNGQDADTPTGPNIPVGGAVLWRYELRNTGDRPMVGVSITDDAGTPATPADDWTMTKASGYVSGDTDNDGALDLTEVWVFQRTGVAVEGQYANLAAVTAQAADNANQPIAALGSYTDDDPSHYWGLTSGLTMKKYTNGLDADTVTGPLVAIGSTVTWTYVVTNTGNTLLTATVVDDKIADDATINCGQGTANVVAIAPSGSVTCTATGTAISGQYANTGTATATAPSTYAANGTVVPGVVLTAADPSHYFGSDPKIQVVKKINGDDANTTPGVRATTPGTLTVTFVVTNTGNVTLDPVTVTDSVIAADQIVCPTKVLAAGASMTCLATYPAPAAGVQHSDTATVTGTPPLLTDGTRQPDVTDTDDAHAWGDPKPDITITKFLNGLDANTAPGPQIVTGDTVNVSFLVTNSGNTRLDSVTVTDSVVSAASISCPKTSLAIGESMTCTGTFIAPAPLTQHTNTGSVVGTPVLSDGIRMIDLATGNPVPVVRDTDPAYAATVQPGMYVVKKINGQDANTAPGVLVVPGSKMQVDFTVFNIGSTRLEKVTVSDDTIPGPITCTPTALDPGQSATCSATYAAPAVGVQHTNTATATATPIVNGAPITPITDTDPANAAAANPMIQVVKKINGQDANDATTAVPTVAGATMTVTFEVENTGNTTLIGVTVTDDVIPAGAISCPDSVLDVGETMTCTAEWAAPAVGQPHTDLATVSGTPTQVDGQPIIDPATGAPMSPVDDKDPATTWTPAHPAVTIVKAINGDDADAAPGVSVAAGSPMAVTFLVTNTGDVRLSPIVVTDSDATTISCPVSSLEPGGSTTCTASIPAPAIGGGHVDTAKVVGSPVQSDGSPALGADGKPLDPVSASNSAHAFVAARPGITVVKTINTDDANSAPGVSVVAGAPLAVKFVVTNTGDVRLAPVTLTDDPVDGLSCQVSELAPGASMECTGTLPGLAAGATHLDTATATGTPVLADGTPVLGVDGLPIGTVQDTDPAYAFAPATSGVTIVKSLNGDDANTAPGVSVAAGAPVTVTFVVTNTGTSFLANVTVTDSLATGITCPGADPATPNVIPLLGPAGSGTASVTCSGTVAALAAGATHVDTGSVSGTPVLADGSTPALGADGLPLPPPSDTDDAYAFAPATAGVTIVKSLNGDDANTAPGVSVAAGAPLSVTFLVTNTGTAYLANVTVTDSLATGITCPGAAADTANVIPLLGPAGSDTASVTCTGTVAALAPGATHVNTGSVSGTPVLADGSTPALGADGLPLPPPTDTDDAYAFAPATSGVSIMKSINGDDANTVRCGWLGGGGPGVSVVAGSPVTVTFVVTNTGTSFLANVTVTDSLATGITCAGAAADTANVIPLLGPAGSDTASVTCTGTVAALAAGATHVDTGSVSGTPVLADGSTPAVGADGLPLPPPSDTDDAYAFAPATSGVSIVKSLNGDDANTAPGVSVAAGAPVTVTFVVTNTGTSFLANVTVTDSLATGITCPGAATDTANVIPLLGPAGSDTASVTCTGTVAALAAGATHVDTGSVSGTPTLADGSTPAVGADGAPLPPPTDTDDAYAFAPATSGVTIVKSLNGDDANTAPGVSVAAGAPVSVTFVVTNTGTSFLANEVTDCEASPVRCGGGHGLLGRGGWGGGGAGGGRMGTGCRWRPDTDDAEGRPRGDHRKSLNG